MWKIYCHNYMEIPTISLLKLFKKKVYFCFILKNLNEKQKIILKFISKAEKTENKKNISLI
jgi:hypothetical protein